MYCKNCGNKLNQDNLYCSKCGANNQVNNKGSEIKYKTLKLAFFRALIGTLCFIIISINYSMMNYGLPFIIYTISLIALTKIIKLDKLSQCFIVNFIFSCLLLVMCFVIIDLFFELNDGAVILIAIIFLPIYTIINLIIDLFTYFLNKIISSKKSKTNCK